MDLFRQGKEGLVNLVLRKFASMRFEIIFAIDFCNMVVVIIEPFYGGSHKQLIDFLTTNCLENIGYELHTLPAKKW